MSNSSTLPILAVGTLGLSSVSCVISSITGFLVSDDSNVESNTNTDTSNTNTDTSNTNTDDTSNTSTSNTSTSNTYTIPHQISLGTDGWCNHWGSVHQDVPGCGRICSSANLVGSKNDDTWGPWEDTTITCNGAKLDEIWEKQDDGTRKLADGYTLPGNKYKYEFIMNKKNHHLGIHVGWVKLDGVLATKGQTTIHKPPNRHNNPDDMFTVDGNAAWNEDGHNEGDKIFTIVSDKKVNKIVISYGRPIYGPGWIIKENGVKKVTETSNRGDSHTPNPVEYTYNI